MDMSLFGRLMDEAREMRLPAVTFGLGSEPLLDPRIAGLVEKAAGAGVMDVRLGTNGQALDRRASEALAGSGLTRLEISVDAAGSGSYRRIRPGGDWDRLVANIEGFLDVRARAGLEGPLLRLSFLNLPDNRGELPLFLAAWEGRADMISVQEPVWFPESLLPEPAAPPPGRVSCRQPWQRLGVLEDGSLWPCCSWHGERLLSGTSAKGGIAGAWAGDAIGSVRRSLEGDSPPPGCAVCASSGKTARDAESGEPEMRGRGERTGSSAGSAMT
jgi:hypothetical protein